MTYRRCEVPVSRMIGMIEIEMQEIENIQKELDGGAINLNDIDNRWVRDWPKCCFVLININLGCRRKMTRYPS